ncbi:flagellar hook-length control protein FliK [Devosia limi]|nr:flagellar hook-length control protein FliK [Devosia limi]
MSIPSQLPLTVQAARNGLQALSLQTGQMLEARVLGPGQNGGTQVQIGRQIVTLQLPLLLEVGTTMQLQVQATTPQLQLALLQQGGKPVVNVALPPPSLPAGSLLAQAATPPPTAPAASAPVLPAAASPAPAIAGQTLAATPSAPLIPGAVAAAATGTSGVPPVPSTAGLSTAPGMPAVGTPVHHTPSQPSGAAQSAIASKAPAIASMPQASPAAMQPAGSSAPAPTAPVTTPLPQPTTPQAALTQMVQASVQRQDSITSLTTALTAIAGKVVLPEPVIRAAQQVQALRLPITGPNLTGATLQKAVLGSGIFQEAALTRLAPGTLPAADMKTALLTLRNTLTKWLGPTAPVTPVSGIAPPVRGSIPRGRGIETPPLDPAQAPEEVGKSLLERTESALSRIRLHQNASLPDPTGRGAADWSTDLPVMIGTHQTLMQLQIHRDAKNGDEAEGERGWQLRFALDIPALGAVGAQVSLRGTSSGVMLWAAEPETVAAIEAALPELTRSLTNIGLRPGTVFCRHGEPPAPAKAPAAGHFVDART